MGSFVFEITPWFQWLIRSTLQVSILVCIVLLVKTVLRTKLAPRWHYYLWLLVVVRMLMPSAPQSRLSIFNLIPDSIEHVNPAPVDETSLAVEIAEAPTVEPHLLARPPLQIVKEQPNPQDSTSLSMSQLLQVLPIIWLAGAIALAIYVFAGNFRLWSIVKLKRPVTQSRVLDLLEDCKAQMNIHTPLAVVETDKITSPALFGFIRPRLLLPEGMLNALDHAQLRHILLHELAHLKRGDIYLGWLVAILQTVHWFNPIVWFGFHRMRSDRELACDNLALSAMSIEEPAEYGRTIVKLLENFSASKYNPGLAGILEERSQLKRRITMIAKFKKSSYRISAGAAILIAILSVVSLTDGHTNRGAERLSERVPANLQDSLLVYYSFDRGAGTKTVDIAGADFHGKVRGAEHISEGRIGGAMSFNGKKDHVQLGRLKLSTFTFAAWIKTQETGSDMNNRRIFLLDDGKNYYTLQGNIDGGIGAYISGNREVNEYDWQLERDEWTHIAITFDGKQAKIYKNGNLTQTGEAQFDGAITGKAYIAYSGDTDKNNTHDGDFNWHGSLDETAIFNRALSTNEIEQLYKMTGSIEEMSSEPRNQSNRLRPGDIVEISVYELLKEGQETIFKRQVSENGLIFLPGSEQPIQVKGMEQDQLRKAIVQRYKEENVLNEASVSVIILKNAIVKPVIGVGDVLRISIYELRQEGSLFVKDYVVTESGRISIPDVGQIRAAGLSEVNLEKEIKNILSPDILKDPWVTVLLLHEDDRGRRLLDGDKAKQVADPAAAANMIAPLYGLFVASSEALIEQNDPEKALSLLETALPQLDIFVAKLKGSDAEVPIAMAVDQVRQMAKAIKEGNIDMAKGLMQAINTAGPQLQKMVEKAAKQKNPAAGDAGPKQLTGTEKGQLFSAFMTIGTTCEHIGKMLFDDNVDLNDTDKRDVILKLCKPLNEIWPKMQAIAKDTEFEPVSIAGANQFDMFYNAVQDRNTELAKTSLRVLQQLGNNSSAMFQKLMQPSKES